MDQLQVSSLLHKVSNKVIHTTLFIIMAEAFGRNIKYHHLIDKWKGAKIEGMSISITHSLFADHTLLFGVSQVSEARKIKKILKLYSNVSGKKINSQKLKIFLFKTNKAISHKICRFWYFLRTFHFPFIMGFFFLWDPIRKSFEIASFKELRAKLSPSK